jgi:Cohesin domain/Dockerin type I domain
MKQSDPSIAGNIIPATLAASAIMALMTTFSFFLVALSPGYIASMELSPTAAVVSLGNTFTTNVEVEAFAPVNAFTGVITFDPTKLQVVKIDYNTSIADLWAEAPWYENGAGTVKFAGGSTKVGGFTGRGSVVTITFRTLAPGDANVRITDAAVLQHDGLGTEAALAAPIDGIFTVVTGNTTATPAKETEVVVRDPKLTGDLNYDGTVTVTDISIFFVHMTTGNTASDLNKDGRISTTDLSILIGQM